MPHYHIVRSGENLSTIAAQYTISLVDLKKCNPGLAGRIPSYGVNPGDKIEICHGKAVAQPPAVTVGKICVKCIRCEFHAATIRCGHVERKYVIKFPRVAGGGVLLQVIASSAESEKIHVEFRGKCGHGKRSGCPGAQVHGPSSTQSGGSVLKADIQLPDQKFLAVESYDYFWKHILCPNTNPAFVYTVHGVTCSGLVFLGFIAAFPKVQWTGELSVGFKHDAQKDSNFNQNQGYKQLKVNGEWTVAGTISVQCDERKWELGLPKAEGSSGHYSKGAINRVVFKGLQSFLDKITPVLGGLNSDYGKLEIMWPNLKLSGGVSNEESKDKCNLDLVGNVKVSLDPLIGVKGSTDILNLIILACPGGFGPFLVKVKKKIAEGYDSKYVTAKAALEIIISASACIKGSIEWRIAQGESWAPKEGEVALEIEFTVEGRAEANFRVLVVKAGGGAKVGAKMTIGAKLKAERGDAGPEIGGKLYFGGLTIYYSYYYEVGGSTLKPGTKSKDRQKSSEMKEQYEHSEPIFGPKSWPEDGQPSRTKLSSGKA